MIPNESQAHPPHHFCLLEATRKFIGLAEKGCAMRIADRSASRTSTCSSCSRRTSPVQGMLRQPNQLRQAFGPGWALVGDAGYYRDAVTAYGISDAFRDAELLAVALDRALGATADAEEAAALARYQQQRDQALREVFEITCRLSVYPPVPAFVELQKQLGAAIDKEAAALAARPVPGERRLATA
jgi:2-polyprenyl-6-methoxyphenol hydroxylase-like FAD-dependent oxidoreductase